MGEVEINTATQQIIIHSIFFFYGSAANEALSIQIAKDIAGHWNINNNNPLKVSGMKSDLLIIGFHTAKVLFY